MRVSPTMGNRLLEVLSRPEVLRATPCTRLSAAGGFSTPTSAWLVYKTKTAPSHPPHARPKETLKTTVTATEHQPSHEGVPSLIPRHVTLLSQTRTGLP